MFRWNFWHQSLFNLWFFAHIKGLLVCISHHTLHYMQYTLRECTWNFVRRVYFYVCGPISVCERTWRWINMKRWKSLLSCFVLVNFRSIASICKSLHDPERFIHTAILHKYLTPSLQFIEYVFVLRDKWHLFV